jgi:N6-L-threonylcarbamoyladenine synthase
MKKILGIDTSCDDTAIAVVKANEKISVLSSVVFSQIKIHKKWGGVYPALAKREHEKNLVSVLKKALKEAGLLKKSKEKKISLEMREKELARKLEDFFQSYSKPKIDFIAVTQGPGLEPCLWTGINFAKALSKRWEIPLISVNHIEAHILANFKSRDKSFFPAISLIASGGHTQIILAKGFKKYSLLGETRDDAAGECFDKTARILGLNYPGGPEIAKKAKKSSSVPALPRPMINQKNYDFSFSGLKTAVLYDYKKQTPKRRISKDYIQGMAFEIQDAITDILAKKTIKAARDHKAKSIIIGGGVAANKELRKKLKEKAGPNIRLLAPKKELCTDNGAMIAIAASFYLDKKTKEIEAEANLAIQEKV